MSYEKNCPERACYECVYSRYNNELDETYCTHDPLPDFIPPRAAVNSCGSCEFWEHFTIQKNMKINSHKELLEIQGYVERVYDFVIDLLNNDVVFEKVGGGMVWNYHHTDKKTGLVRGFYAHSQGINAGKAFLLVKKGRLEECYLGEFMTDKQMRNLYEAQKAYFARQKQHNFLNKLKEHFLSQ